MLFITSCPEVSHNVTSSNWKLRSPASIHLSALRRFRRPHFRDCCQALPALPPMKGDEPVAQSDLTRMGLNVTADAPKYFAAPVAPPYGRKATKEPCASVL